MSYEKLVNHRIESRFSFYAAVCVALIALGVLAGWHLHMRALVQVIPGTIPMQYNTALCFLVLSFSAGAMLRRRELFPTIGGGFAALMGALVIFQYAAGITLGVDTFFFFPWEQTLSAHPGRMALTSAISFTVAGIALILFSQRQRTLVFFVIAHTLPLSLGLTSLLGYLFGITYVLPFRLGSQMAVHTATAFTIYGGAMLFYAWQYIPQNQDGMPKWMPGIAVVMVPVFFVSLSSSLQNSSLPARIVQFLFAFIGFALPQNNLTKGELNNEH